MQIPNEIKETLADGLLAMKDQFDANQAEFDDYEEEEVKAFDARVKAAYAFLGLEMPQ